MGCREVTPLESRPLAMMKHHGHASSLNQEANVVVGSSHNYINNYERLNMAQLVDLKIDTHEKTTGSYYTTKSFTIPCLVA